MKQKITADTVIISAFSMVLQLLSIALNIIITKNMGESAVGILSLVSQFFVFALTLSNGNIFSVSSRFISEEIGRKGNVEKVISYCLFSGVGLSIVFSVCLFFLAKKIYNENLSLVAIRIMALSLPLATTGSCIKGYFHARRMVIIPCVADFTEFFVKGVSLILMILAFAKNGIMDILTCSAVSVMSGEIVSCIMLCIFYAREKLPHSDENAKISFKQFIKLSLPITVGAYIFVLLSGSNEALVPLMLKNFSDSYETALSQYGIFEGIIIPVIFFPSTLLQSLSLILLPETARETQSKNSEKVKELSSDALRKAFSIAIISAFFIFSYADELGGMLSDSPLVIKTLKLICPVIPFIYVEIVTESILKGMGKQTFCIINSMAEYIIRISAVLIFVKMIGFYGVIVSYFLSNIICNIVRISALMKLTGVSFDFVGNILIPVFSSMVSIKLSRILWSVFPVGVFSLIISGIFSVILFILISVALGKFCLEKTKKSTFV